MDAEPRIRRPTWNRRLALAALTMSACSTEDPAGPSIPVHPLPAQPIARPHVAFVSNRDGQEYIYVASADGSAVGRLALGTAPAWSWDGQKIAYVGPGIGGIRVMSADGADPTQLSEDGGHPGWSPDGRIAFGRGGEDGGIFVMNGDGTGLTKLIDADFPVDPDDSEEGFLPSLWDPTWSPDGQTIAFMRAVTGAPLLYLANADGTDVRRFPAGLSGASPFGPPWFGSPTFSPDGTSLAFEYWHPYQSTGCSLGSVYPSGGSDPAIATASLDATELSELEMWCTPGTFIPRSPSWSHHGTEQLVFSQASSVGSSWDDDPNRLRIYHLILADLRWQQLVPEAVDPANPSYDDTMPTWAPVPR